MKKKSLSAKKTIHKKLLTYLKDPVISKIYKNFNNFLFVNNNFEKLSVAVSGGADSLALAYLVKCYSILNNVAVKYYHVNHNLRKESSEEADILKSHLRNFDINCKILIWKGKKPNSNIQSAARNKRYSLISSHSLKNNVNCILVGHHSEDLYENFLIRLLRGSGLKGLVSFNQLRTDYSNSMKILRPLINFKKSELVYIAKKIFNFYINDPSNKNTKFKRVRIRHLISKLKNEGLDEKKLRLTINNLSDSNFTINHYVLENIKLNSNYLKNKKAYIVNKIFFDQPHEIVFRSLSNVLKRIGKKYYSSRGRSVDQVIQKIKLNSFNKVTLSGCVIEKLNNSLIIYQETAEKSQNCHKLALV